MRRILFRLQDIHKTYEMQTNDTSHRLKQSLSGCSLTTSHCSPASFICSSVGITSAMFSSSWQGRKQTSFPPRLSRGVPEARSRERDLKSSSMGAIASLDSLIPYGGSVIMAAKKIGIPAYLDLRENHVEMYKTARTQKKFLFRFWRRYASC